MNKLLNAVFNLRYAAVLAVIAPFVGAVLMMLLGTRDTIEAYLIFFGFEEPEGAVEAGEAAMIKLVASVDHFLFGTILIIFAIGLYKLLFRVSSGSKKGHNSRKTPSWKEVKNLGGMDEMLLKVIIMLLAVAFLEFMLNAGLGSLDWPVMVVPLTIIALAIGLRWMSQEGDGSEVKKEKVELQVAKLDELERLADLHERGAITDAEFESAKEKLKL
jgi:uncharacterized membrane protein YqhA